MSITTASFSQVTHFVKNNQKSSIFVPTGLTNWNDVFSKNSRKTSSESCESVTTAESVNDSLSKQSYSPSTESPREAFEYRPSVNSIADQDDYLNSSMKPKKKAAVDDEKYKTELCKKFESTGFCPYNKKCKFAHGKEELNEKLLANKRRYKSKKCNNFHTLMMCPYGSRCLFAHEERTVEEIEQNTPYDKFLLCPELLAVSNRKRLPCFGKLAPADSQHC